MAKTLAIRVGNSQCCRVCISQTLEVSVRPRDIITLECMLAQESRRVQIVVGEIGGVKWLPTQLENRLYKWDELCNSSTDSEIQLSCSDWRKELQAKEAEVKELTASAVEMQQAAGALMRKYEEVMRTSAAHKSECDALIKRLTKAQTQVTQLQSALSASALEVDRLSLQNASLKAKSAIYEATLQALRSSPAQDEIDELLRDRLSGLDAPVFVRICEGQYFCEGEQLAITVKAGALSVRQGEGFQPLEDWLRERVKKNAQGSRSQSQKRKADRKRPSRSCYNSPTSL